MIILTVTIVVGSSICVIAMLVYAYRFPEKRQYFLTCALTVFIGMIGISTFLLGSELKPDEKTRSIKR